jgi:hypothetical protein
MFVPPLRLATLVLFVGLLPGCELIASFDRDEIPEPGFMVPDATTLPPDGVIEGGLPDPDGGTDAGMDASVDAGPDASEPGMDASSDAGEEDAGMDAGADAGGDDGGM